jgi:hypothetical protein
MKRKAYQGNVYKIKCIYFFNSGSILLIILQFGGRKLMLQLTESFNVLILVDHLQARLAGEEDRNSINYK